MIDSRLENFGHAHVLIPPHVPFEQLLDDFMNLPNVLEIDYLESDDESVDTPLVSPFLDSDDESDDGEVLDELDELDEKFVANFDPFLPMNIITRKAYNTVNGKELGCYC
ncbi:hypothetical protein Tco_0431746 [Tanacetum coccineum]